MASSSDSASRYLTIATLNVHGWHNESAGSWEGLIDLLSPVDESAPDVLCVQEIRPHKRNVKKSGGGKKRQPPPDILCLEEATKHRIPALAKALGGYHFITRDNTAILSRLPMEAAGPGHWNGSGPQKSKKETRSECRVRHSAARIKPPNGDAEIEVVCLHLDHVSETTRLAQLRQLNEYLASVADKPPVERRIFCGDFNALTKSDYSNEEWKDIFDVRSSNSWESPVREVTRVMKAAPTQKEPYCMQMIDAWEAAPKERRIGPLGTSRFNTRIDYIYLSSALDGAVRACEHCVAMPLVSDHNMVKATIDLKHKMGTEEKRERKKKRDAAGDEGRAASGPPASGSTEEVLEEPPVRKLRSWGETSLRDALPVKID